MTLTEVEVQQNRKVVGRGNELEVAIKLKGPEELALLLKVTPFIFKQSSCPVRLFQ